VLVLDYMAARVFDEWPDNASGPSDGVVGDIARGFGEAHVIVEARLTVPRVAAMPIEPRGVLVQPEAPDGRLTIWTSTQVPFAVRAAIAAALSLAEEQVRVIAPDVGGGFGWGTSIRGRPVTRGGARLRRPVRIETRREHFLPRRPIAISAIAPRRRRRDCRGRDGVHRDGGAYRIGDDLAEHDQPSAPTDAHLKARPSTW
jgi:CO/xanthine dehydrogenase Mo-binding subunit